MGQCIPWLSKPIGVSSAHPGWMGDMCSILRGGGFLHCETSAGRSSQSEEPQRIDRGFKEELRFVLT